MHARIINSALDILAQANVYKLSHRLLPNLLTVLNYHRIDDPAQPGFDTFKPNVSATPENFARQMDYVAQNYQVVTCEFLAAFLRGEKKLPPRRPSSLLMMAISTTCDMQLRSSKNVTCQP